MDRQQRNLFILGILLLVLLVGGCYVLLLGPLREDLAERRAEREAKQERLTQLDAEVARLEDIQSRAPETERRLLELSRRVPEQPELPTLVVQVQEIAEESGVIQLLVQPEDPEEPEDGGDYTVVPVTMTFEGTYDQLQDFLLRLRNLTRLVTVENIVYEVAEEESEDGEGEGASPGEDRTLHIELGAEVYAQPGESGIQTNTAPEDSATDVEGGSEEDSDAE